MWADVTPVSQDYEAPEVTADWISGNTGRYTVSIETAETNHYLSVAAVGNGNNGAYITSTTIKDKAVAGTDFETSDNFTLIFDLQLTGGDNQQSNFFIADASDAYADTWHTPSTTGTILWLKAKAKGSTTWVINNNSDQEVTLDKKTWYTFKLSKSDALLYLTITKTSDDTEVLARTTIDILSTFGGLGTMNFNTQRYNSAMAFDNLTLRAIQDGDVPVAQPTTYTIKYKDSNNNTIKDDVVVNSVVGEEVTASSAQVAAVYYNDKKYLYNSGNDAITLVADAASNVITLVYREAEVYNYSLLDNLGNTITSGSGFEEDNVVLGYSHYALIDGVFYEASATDKEYRKTIALTADNATATVNYSAKEGVDAVFFAEGENVEGMTESTAGNIPIRASNAKAGVSSEDLTITTLAPGKYILHVGTFTSKSSDQTIYIGYGETQIAFSSKSNLNETASEEITLNAETAIKYFGTTSSTDAQFDYIWIEKTDVPQTVTIGADGFASFSSAKALDFTGTTIKAYVATAAADGVVTMSRVNKVPANTGLIIQGTTASVPVVDGEAETISTNLLKPGTGANVAASTEGTYHYVFAKQSDKFGFYNLTDAKKVEKGKAYLETTTALAAEARLVFVDETTGIANVNSQMNDVKSVFNLNGQRVEKAQKGLFIVNGKKVLVK